MEVAKGTRARAICEQEQTLDNSESVAFLGCVIKYCERHLDEIQGPVQMENGSKKDLTGRELIAHLSAKYPALFRECRKQRALKHDLYITDHRYMVAGLANHKYTTALLDLLLPTPKCSIEFLIGALEAMGLRDRQKRSLVA